MLSAFFHHFSLNGWRESHKGKSYWSEMCWHTFTERWKHIFSCFNYVFPFSVFVLVVAIWREGRSRRSRGSDIPVYFVHMWASEHCIPCHRIATNENCRSCGTRINCNNAKDVNKEGDTQLADSASLLLFRSPLCVNVLRTGRVLNANEIPLTALNPELSLCKTNIPSQIIPLNFEDSHPWQKIEIRN